MAADVIHSNKTQHLIRHDLESVYYVLLYIAILTLGPNGDMLDTSTSSTPWFIKTWADRDSFDPGTQKIGALFMGDDSFEHSFLKHVSRYFECMKPLLLTLRKAVREYTVDHDFVIDALKKTIEDLEPGEPEQNPKPRSWQAEYAEEGPKFVNMGTFGKHVEVRCRREDGYMSGKVVSSAPAEIPRGVAEARIASRISSC